VLRKDSGRARDSELTSCSWGQPPARAALARSATPLAMARPPVSPAAHRHRSGSSRCSVTRSPLPDHEEASRASSEHHARPPALELIAAHKSVTRSLGRLQTRPCCPSSCCSWCSTSRSGPPSDRYVPALRPQDDPSSRAAAARRVCLPRDRDRHHVLDESMLRRRRLARIGPVRRGRSGGYSAWIADGSQCSPDTTLLGLYSARVRRWGMRTRARRTILRGAL
jgi:hypothetical protein